MAKKAAAPMRLEDRLIEDVVKRLADPVAFLAWADGFQGAERVGRIKRSKLSVLDYLLTAYVGRHIDSIYGEEARTVALVTDEEVCVSHTTRTDPPVQTTVHVAYRTGSSTSSMTTSTRSSSIRGTRRSCWR
jgi:hypothetical protein